MSSRNQRHRSTVRPSVEQLEQRETPTVNFYGGNLLPHVEAQAVFYGADWNNVSTQVAQKATIDASLVDVTGGAYMDTLTNAGYNVYRGTASPGFVDPVTNISGTTITDAAIRARIQTDIMNPLSGAQQPDANRLYIVYVEPNVAITLGGNQTTQNGILGWHGAFGGTDINNNPVTIRYAVIAYPGGTTIHNSRLVSADVDQLTAVASHELAEAVTDPDVNYSRLGWYDPRRGEIADITENNPSALVRLDGYLVQEVAGKNDQLLTISNPNPNPPPSSQVSTTTTMTAGPVNYPRRGNPTVTLTITVTPASGTTIPDGTIELIYNGTILGTGQLRVVNGVATVTFNLVFYARGTYTFSAAYLGSSAFLGSASNSVTVTV